MTCLFVPIGTWCANSIDAVRLHVDVGRFHTLMILVAIDASPGLALSQLRVQSCRLVGLIDLHPFDRLATGISLRIVALSVTSSRVYHNFATLRVRIRRLH